MNGAPRTLAIVGAGASGTLAAIHLLRRATPPLRVLLFDTASPGRGVAFRTTDPLHLLNVRASSMSADPEAPLDFVDWLRAHAADAGRPIDGSEFVSRALYARYLHDALGAAQAAAASGVVLEQVRSPVVNIDPDVDAAAAPDAAADAERPVVVTADGQRLPVQLVVLALGNFRPRPLRIPGASPSLVRDDPWQADALDGLDPAAGVLLVGTGLTMVDAVISLVGTRHHRGPVYAVSRRGLLPQAHAELGPDRADWGGTVFATTARGLLRQVRRRAQARDADWRAEIDGLRSATQDIWRQLPPLERERFLRHLVPYWDTHRHRIAPEVGRLLADAVARGQLRVWAGRIQRAEPIDDGTRLRVHIRPRRGQALAVDVARIVNCTGPATDYERLDDPLVAALLRRGLVRPDAHRLGLATTHDGRLIDAQGRPSRVLFSLGPMRRAELWETTAVPDIRVQAAELARVLDAALSGSGER